MTIAEVAARWKCSRDTVERLIRNGKLKCQDLSDRVIRVPLWAVEEYERTAVRGSADPENPGTQADPTSSSNGRNATPPETRAPSGSQQKKLLKN
jgi:excisionase family DNA binding protein